MSAPLAPDRLAPLHDALTTWRLLARSAADEARADQRRLNLDLLQASRQLAAALDGLGRLEREHERHGLALDRLRVSAVTTAQRIEHRLAAMRRLDEAARRHHADPRLAAAAAPLVAMAAEQLEQLTAAAATACRTLAETDRRRLRHQATGEELRSLRDALTAARERAEQGLVLMTTAGKLLRDTADVYESAQLSASDVRREWSSEPPTGPALVDPIPMAADRALASPLAASA